MWLHVRSVLSLKYLGQGGQGSVVGWLHVLKLEGYA